MKKLRPATKRHMKWGYDNSIDFYGYRLKSGKTTCMECGHTFHTEDGTRRAVCPHCGKVLTVNDTLQRKLSQVGYFSIITTANGLQVLRYFFIRTHQWKGEKADYECTEVMQRWMDKNGNTCTTSRLRAPYSYCVDESLLTNPKTETLVKTGYHGLARKFIYDHYRNRDLYWASVKVCIRNHYVIKDASMWCDYIDALRYFGKDLHNAKYVCPTDLRAEHDKWMEKKERKQTEQSIKEKIAQALQDEQKFKELKSRYFGIRFTDGLICVRVLESVEEHLQEGEHMHHCVFRNAYYLKKNSLILSATIDGKRIETIELALDTLEVVQSRGVQNKLTEYHDRIIDLVNKNAYLIGNRRQAA